MSGESNNKKKSWRRLTIGVVWFVSFHVTFYWLVSKGVDVEVIKTYITTLTLGSLVFGGYITTTDALERWKK